MTTLQQSSPAPADSDAPRLIPELAGLLIGAVVVVNAVIVGLLLGLLLGVLGVTETPVLPLGPWLAGAGLWGGWSQDVSSNLPNGAGWTTWAAGAPLLVSAAAGLPAARMFRRLRPGLLGVGVACLTAALLAFALVAFSGTSSTTSNSAGTVTVTEGLTRWWTSGIHPGTVIGAALFVLVIGLANTVLLPWWSQARRLAWGLVVVPGAIVTVLLMGGVFYLTSKLSAGLSVGLLLPLAGTLVVLGLGGAPLALGVTRAAPEPYRLETMQGGLLLALGGLVVVVVIAVLVGLVLRRRHSPCPFWTGVIATAAFALWLVLLMDTTVGVPQALGAETTVSMSPIAAALVAGVMAVVALLIRGRGRTAASE